MRPRLSTRGRLVAGSLTAGALIGLAWQGIGSTARPARTAAAPVTSDRPAAVAPPAPSASASASTAAAHSALAAAAFRCVEQQVSATINGRAEPQCFGRSTSLQSGSVVSYRFEGRSEAGARWLAADVAGSEVVAVSAGRGARAEFACVGDACSGLSVGPADLYGVRTLTLAHLQLPPTESADVGNGAGLRLDGTLSTTADGAAADAPACAGQTVWLSGPGGRTSRFCPGDGIAVSRNDDGGWTYRFASAETTALVVELDGAAALRRVEHGAMACAAPSCAGIEWVASAPRTLRFNGTLIQGGSAGTAWETLSGSLLLPSW